MNDLERTRALLDRMNAEQERLAARLDGAGIASFADRADWLIAHRTPDERLAWRRHWIALGLTDAEPRPRAEPLHLVSRALVAPCARCGIRRATRPGRASNLCTDCRYVLSKEEREAWAS